MTREDYKAASDAIWKVDRRLEGLIRDLVEAEQSETADNVKRIYATNILMNAARQMLREADGILGRTLVTG